MSHISIACRRVFGVRFAGAIIVVFAMSGTASAAYHILPDKSVARNWSEVFIEALRHDAGQVAVNARNVFHFSIAVYDAWAAFDSVAKPYLLGNTVGEFTCPFDGYRLAAGMDMKQARETAISYAAYRFLRHRFRDSAGAAESYSLFFDLFAYYGLDPGIVSTDYSTGSPAALGNYVAQCLIDFGLSDGSNEAGRYAAQHYRPVNQSLDPTDPRSIDAIVDPDHWQNLALDVFINKTGNVTAVPDFETPEWGRVVPFAMTEDDRTVYQRDGTEYWVYHDPGKPALISMTDPDALPEEYIWGHSLVAVWTGQLDPTVGHGAELIDISPASIGNNPPYPATIPELRDFYFLLGGGDSSRGHPINPVTGLPYEPQYVPLGDYARVLLQYWADGPFTAETPAGFMMALLNNQVSDAPGFEKRLGGTGPLLDDLEWDVKAYFIVSAATHDAAIAAWSVKGWYDYIRPISAIRFMASKGQSSDPGDPDCRYDAQGIRYIDDPSDPAGDGSKRVIDCVRPGDPLDGGGENVGKIKVFSWRGPDAVVNRATDVGGVGWILAENWWPMMRPEFVTPPFAGYVSGHSTLTRAGAEALTLLTGSSYFPSGMYEYKAEKDNFLVYERGPSVDVTLQWATYYDVSDAAGVSRLWGGVHPPVDDMTGRRIGAAVGVAAFSKAMEYVQPQTHTPPRQEGGGGFGWLSIVFLCAAYWYTLRRRRSIGAASITNRSAR